MKLLLHCCCGPCSLAVADYYREQGHSVQEWFYNPNIYPLEELTRREAAMRDAAGSTPRSCSAGPLTCESKVQQETLLDFLLHLARHGGRRCHACYQLRLEAAAQEAARLGCKAFSTTLTISPYQDQPAIEIIGRTAGEQHGVRFLCEDLRGRFHENCDRARELDLYQQNYCGCVFSLLERNERRAKRKIEKALRLK